MISHEQKYYKKKIRSKVLSSLTQTNRIILYFTYTHTSIHTEAYKQIMVYIQKVTRCSNNLQLYPFIDILPEHETK